MAFQTLAFLGFLALIVLLCHALGRVRPSLGRAALLLGYKTAERLFEMGRITGSRKAIEKLDGVLYHKIPYISDYI